MTAKLTSNLRMLFILLSKVPLMTRVAILHVLKLSEPSKYVDLQSNLVVSLMRSVLTPANPHSISYSQRLTTRNEEINGRIWISFYASPPPPETDIRDSLLNAIDGMRDGGVRGSNTRVPELVPVEAEWTGYRAAASKREPLPNISESAKYHQLMKECKEPTTVLYFHGGAYFLCDPATHRPLVKRLAKLIQGRCYSVRYRLAPQDPFPSALLDALVSYFTLLYPPPDAYHDAVEPEHIVIAGDRYVEASGFGKELMLCNIPRSRLSSTMYLRRLDVDIQWYGEKRKVPLPAGVSCISPWIDITQSSPPWHVEDAHPFDYLPRLRPDFEARVPPCEIWPANPPRKFIYADDDLVAHPLATLFMSRSWEGSPPVWMSTGWEILSYENKAFAMQLFAEGVALVFEEYEAMPHVFPMCLAQAPSSRRCLESWAGFIRRAMADPGAIEASATSIAAQTLEETPLRFDDLLEDRLEDIRAAVVTRAGVGVEKADVAARL
ncbi:hypothetical protein THARTR1_10365 [Trichoderma harzianum]|uniref:Alpha/beta hydrolase fold-3 domain-containing protein n=1 Tax=Trichoderma harzianum TaxID=5544 RepID=A0A2K0TRR6_TRIHA|nr:hypothetical protein THARTR1_10365 [Trichoderma harzianum]